MVGLREIVRRTPATPRQRGRIATESSAALERNLASGFTEGDDGRMSTPLITPAFLAHYFDYCIWADLRQLTAVRAVSVDQQTRDFGFSFKTMRHMLMHMMAGQSVWLDRFEGVPPVWLMDDAKFPTVEAVAGHWPTVHARGKAFFANLTLEQCAQTLSYTNMLKQQFEMPRWQLMFHMVQHGLHHRGQLNSMLTLAGGQGCRVDYTVYAAEHPIAV
jgi:uncharacterized damage-inducible protein DinB